MKRIVCVGRLAYAKGVQDLIWATQKMNVEVNIVGDGVYRCELEKLAHKNVCFLGTMDREQVRDELRRSDLLVMPSYNEGLPTTILEAGALNVPVVSSDVGAVRDVIKEGFGYIYDAGNVFQLRELILNAFANPPKGLREIIVEDFSWKKNAVKFIEVLKSV